MRLPEPRPDLGDLKPYRTSSVAGARIRLHANENPYSLPEEVREEILSEVRALDANRYPPDPTELRERLAAYVGVDPGWVWLGDGSNEVLLHACLAYGGAGRRALLFEPTYPMHHRQARIAGTGIIEIRRGPDFSIDIEGALGAVDEDRPEMVFVCSPNNPTGTLTPQGDVRRLVEASEGLVVLDEAYHEFCGESFVGELADHPNALVVRTLSKAFGLAGIRVGYGVARPELLKPFARVRMPYSVSAYSLAAATVVLRHVDLVLERVRDIVAERDRLARELASLDGMEVFPSSGNAVLFRHPEAARLIAGLAEGGIVIRDFTTLPGCEGCLRVTAGTPEEGTAFLETVRGLL